MCSAKNESHFFIFLQKINWITWFGKPNAHLGQDMFTNLINGNYAPHFFALYDSKNPVFIYLDIG